MPQIKKGAGLVNFKFQVKVKRSTYFIAHPFHFTRYSSRPCREKDGWWINKNSLNMRTQTRDVVKNISLWNLFADCLPFGPEIYVDLRLRVAVHFTHKRQYNPVCNLCIKKTTTNTLLV